MSRKSAAIMCTLLLLLLTVVSSVTAASAPRPVPEQIGKAGLQDTTGGLKGDTAALQQALSEAATVKFKILVIDDTYGEDREAFLDRVLAEWGWPDPDTLLVIIYTKANHDIRFAMGSDFRLKWNISLDEMLVYVRELYLRELRSGDPARALAEYISAVTRRAKPKQEAFAALSLPEGKPARHDEVVRAFYAWYIDYIGPVGQPPKASVLADRAYRTSPYLTPAFISRIDTVLADMDKSGGGADPFLCAQAVPDDIELYLTQEEGDRATTTIRTFFGISRPRLVNVDLVRTGGRWLIDAIRCPKP